MSSTTKPPAGSAPNQAPRISDQSVATIVILVLLSTWAIFVLLALPRAVARFASTNAWSQGWILKFSSPRARDPLRRNPTIRRGNDFVFNNATDEKRSPATGSVSRLPPIHIASWKTILFPITSNLFSSRLSGFSLAQLCILTGYAILIAIGVLLYSNPVTNAKRAGWIALSQFPVSVALASKNSLVGLLLGKGYEKLNYIHRFVGQLMFIAILFHVVSYLVMWTKANDLSTKITGWVQITGLISFGGVCLLAIGSIGTVRRKSWAIFTYTHWVGFGVTMVATCYHVPVAIPFSLSAIGLYAFDLILKTIQSHYTTAHLQYIPELRCTRITIPSLRSGWRAGQHVRLCVPSTAMGTSLLESHPFTIASVSNDEEGLVLYCSEAGDWTKKLSALAKGGRQADELSIVRMRLEQGKDRAIEEGHGRGTTANVLVQGPYGGPGNVVFSSFSAATFVCGGSGITFGLGATQEVVRDAFDRTSRVRLVDLVWIVQDPSAIIPFLPAFMKLKSQADVIESLSLRICVYYTRASATTQILVDRNVQLPDGIELNPGRPDLSDLLSATISCASVLKHSTREGVHGVIVGACGPKELLKSVREADRSIGKEVRKAVGGVELLEEAFGW